MLRMAPQDEGSGKSSKPEDSQALRSAAKLRVSKDEGVRATAQLPQINYLKITPRGGGLNAISAIIFFTIAWPKESWFSATMTKAPPPPITLLR
jgi:hypothetical protein